MPFDKSGAARSEARTRSCLMGLPEGEGRAFTLTRRSGVRSKPNPKEPEFLWYARASACLDWGFCWPANRGSGPDGHSNAPKDAAFHPAIGDIRRDRTVP